MFFYQHFVNVEFYFEESRITSAASIGSAILNVILNFALIPKFGYLAAGYTTLFSYILFGIVHYVFMRIICKKNQCPQNIFDIRKMLLIMLLFLVMSGMMAVGYNMIIVRWIVIIVLVLAVIGKRDVIKSYVGQFMKK